MYVDTFIKLPREILDRSDKTFFNRNRMCDGEIISQRFTMKVKPCQ